MRRPDERSCRPPRSKTITGTAVRALEWSITTAIPGADGVSDGLTCVPRQRRRDRQLIGQLILSQLGRPTAWDASGPSPLKCNDVPRQVSTGSRDITSVGVNLRPLVPNSAHEPPRASLTLARTLLDNGDRAGRCARCCTSQLYRAFWSVRVLGSAEGVRTPEYAGKADVVW